MHNLAFETIGNATLICYDKTPILITDPWIEGNPYFGSWQHSYEIPSQQLEAIKQSKYCWFSHGHPDHLNCDSLYLVKDKQILLPNHYGDRIYNDLKNQGYSVKILKDKKWYNLSKNISVLCIAHSNQDAILLINMDGKLILNFNDCPMPDIFCKKYISKIIKKSSKSFLLKLSGFGDADMINYYDQDNNFIPRTPIKDRESIGSRMSKIVDQLGINYFIPFSSMHRYQRSDSIWANKYIANLSDYSKGYYSDKSEILPAFIRYNCISEFIEPINPLQNTYNVIEPEQFNDNWSDELNRIDIQKINQYFLKINHLHNFLDYINIRVGAKDNIIIFKKNKFKRGLQFDVPRHSLMESINHQIFDDLLIGNFMKTTLHGDWPDSKLYPDFTPFVSKYSDNGDANSQKEIEQYFNAYNKRWPLEYFISSLAAISKNTIRYCLPNNSILYDKVKMTYNKIREIRSKIFY